MRRQPLLQAPVVVVHLELFSIFILPHVPVISTDPCELEHDLRNRFEKPAAVRRATMGLAGQARGSLQSASHDTCIPVGTTQLGALARRLQSSRI